MAALRTERDWAMVQAMLLGGLRRCEVLGLRLEDLRLGEWRVFIAEGQGGHQRLVPVSQTCFATVARYLNNERPAFRVDGARVRRAEGPNEWRRVERRARRDVDQRDPGRLLTRPRAARPRERRRSPDRHAVGWPSSATSPAHRRVPSAPGG
jgi:site-specific recombinase XerC